MDYEYLNSSIERNNIILPNSDKINPFLLKNNQSEIIKGVDFIASKEKFLYVHGFMGTGKRQYVNYICEFLNKDVIKLEYYCKESTVCDDILLTFNEIIDNNSMSKAVNLNAKITTLGVKFQQQISSIKKPFLIVLHSFDDVQEENIGLIKDLLLKILREENIKLIISTRAMMPSLLGDIEEDRKIFLKAFTKENFKEYLVTNKVNATEQTYDDFYKYTRGYYYYVALSVKIIQAMNISLNEFLQKFNQSDTSFDSYLGITYINLVPSAIRNFFWFLRTVRHGLSLNALAVFEIYDEFSIEYLKTNLMIFQVDEMLYVQDYFLQKIDISIPEKTQIKLHKYIVGIYEKQLKIALKERAIMISRQALRAEIEYHNKCVAGLKNVKDEKVEQVVLVDVEKKEVKEIAPEDTSISALLKKVESYVNDKKYTEAIESLHDALEYENIDLPTLVDVRLKIARLYKKVGENQKASHYFELVETYYIQHKELINLSYLYYDMTELYYNMYKLERAVDTIKKVIYSVDTPQSLLVSACTLLGNIYSDMDNSNEAYIYYKKALDSLDENVEDEILAELYFKFALANDDKGDSEQAFEYYNRCISLNEKNSYKALAYSNLASCYYDNGNYDEAISCFKKAFNIEKENNNFDGIYYNAKNLGKILFLMDSKNTLEYLIEAKKSAEFLNEQFYILESHIALGDYYYNNSETYSKASIEYFEAKKIAKEMLQEVDITKIDQRISDMRARMNSEEFLEIENKYGK